MINIENAPQTVVDHLLDDEYEFTVSNDIVSLVTEDRTYSAKAIDVILALIEAYHDAMD